MDVRIIDKLQLTQAALLGEAVGDAFGVPYEFLPREIVRFVMDSDEMMGCDSESPLKTRWGETIPSGAWSDDTSMTLASFASIIDNNGLIDYEDHLRRFVSWWNESKYCCLQFSFGLGGAVSKALQRFIAGSNALDSGGTELHSNGNGSLMRMLPFSLYCIFNELNQQSTLKLISDASSITHAHEISKICCCVWTEFLRVLVDKGGIHAAVSHIELLDYTDSFSETAIKELAFIWEKRVLQLSEDEINETGYVVDTLKSALYSLVNSDDYMSSIITAVKLGYDTDTTAAITGSAAVILYGIENIPIKWLNKLLAKDIILDTAAEFGKLFEK